LRISIAACCTALWIAAAIGADAAYSQGIPSTLPKKLMEAAEAPPVHGFSVALVLGDMQGASTADNLPVGARKALSDMRDFLPYKSFRLLDVQFIRCCASTKGDPPPVSGRLRGNEEQQYSFLVDYGFMGSRLSIRFILREEALLKKLGTSSASDASLVVAQLEEKRRQYGSNHPSIKELERQVREIEEQSRAASPSKSAVVDSTFSMDIGETVVIGTSSLKGEKALIALLTAVRRPDPPQGEKK
jgi:hypothetical protein